VIILKAQDTDASPGPDPGVTGETISYEIIKVAYHIFSTLNSRFRNPHSALRNT
jgi:hypothetical protein